MISTTYVSDIQLIQHDLINGIAIPYIRYDDISKTYEVGYCSSDSNKYPSRVFMFKNKIIEHVDFSTLKGKAYMDLIKDGYMRIYTTSLYEHLEWNIVRNGVYDIAILVRVDNE